jgi:hypothetical protein
MLQVPDLSQSSLFQHIIEDRDNVFLNSAIIKADVSRPVTLHPRVTGNNNSTLVCLALFLASYRFCCSAIQETRPCVYPFSLDKTSSTVITPRSAKLVLTL